MCFIYKGLGIRSLFLNNHILMWPNVMHKNILIDMILWLKMQWPTWRQWLHTMVHQIINYIHTSKGSWARRHTEEMKQIAPCHCIQTYSNKSQKELDRKHCRRNSVGENPTETEVRGWKFQPGLRQISWTLWGSGLMSV